VAQNQPNVFQGWQGIFTPAAACSIASGQSVSSAIECKGQALVGIQLPAAFTGTTLTFEASIDGVTYQPVYNTTSGTALSYTVAQGHYVAINPQDFLGVNYLKIVSGGTEAALRNFTVALKGY
jgi:hypothetical protein